MKCNRCELYKTAQSVCLLGRGPKPCNVMLVGEAPGKREDDINKPFSGQAGEVLDSLLHEAGVKRKDVYITNAVRCRPPKNRKPKASEIKACSYWMDYELKEVNPKYVMLLGGVALKIFSELRKDSITTVRGRFFKIGDYQVFPTFHPASVLYDENKRAILKVDWENFWKAVRDDRVENKPRFNPITVDTKDCLSRCLQDLRDNQVISFDLETGSLNPWSNNLTVMAGFGTRNNQWVIPLNHRECRLRIPEAKLFRELAGILNDKKVITQNGKFDTLWVKVKYGVDIKISHDTMIMSYLLDENTPNGLKFLASTYFGAPDYDISKEEKTGAGQLATLVEYNANDVYYTRRLFFLFRDKLRDDNRLWRFYKHVMIPAIEVFREVEYNGIYLDPQRLKELEETLIKGLQKVSRKLSKYGSINWNSTQQVADLLFNQMDIKPLAYTSTGNQSTAEPVMKRLARDHEVASLILKYREFFKSSSTFVSSWKEKAESNRLHPTFNLIRIYEREGSKGTVTGRLSCTNPNLQQVPRDPKLRSVLQAPEGWTFVEADLSQIELRIVAMLSGDRAMKSVFQTGGDIHTKTAIEISGVDLSGQKGFEAKEWRKKAKATNFGFVYGMGVEKFIDYARDKYEIDFSWEEGEQIRERFFTTYKDLRPWHEKQKRIARINGYVRCLSGRIRHLPDIESPDKALRASAERKAINSPVQGLASDITLMAAIEIHNKSPHDKVRIVGTVHDSILLEVKNEYLDRALPKIKSVMEKPQLFDTLGLNPTVPIIAEVSVGPWGSGIKKEA